MASKLMIRPIQAPRSSPRAGFGRTVRMTLKRAVPAPGSQETARRDGHREDVAVLSKTARQPNRSYVGRPTPTAAWRLLGSFT